MRIALNPGICGGARVITADLSVKPILTKGTVMKKIRLKQLKLGRSLLGTVALVMLLVAGLPVSAQKGTLAVKALPNIVLVHGAWADGSSWSGVIQRLQAAGYNVTAPP